MRCLSFLRFRSALSRHTDVATQQAPPHCESANTQSKEMIFQTLSRVDTNNAPKLFTMNGTERWCKVIQVYDGDTVNIVFVEKSGELRHHKLRLFGIDSPELKPSKNLENRDVVISKAQMARDFLCALILDRIVYVRFKNEEKFGRMMGDIFLSENPSDVSVNRLLVDSGHAVEYFGGKKNA